MLLRSLIALGTVSLVLACSAEAADTSDQAGAGSAEAEEAEGEEGAEVVGLPPPATGNLSFEQACRQGTQVTLAAVGDVLLHARLQRQAYAEGHASLWHEVQPLLARADLTYGNLEGPTADGHTRSGLASDPGRRYDNAVYTSYPQFNYHPSLVTDLKASGFDVVSTANNHALDRRGSGADRTIEHLKAGELAFTGTRSSANMSAPWYATTEAKGVRVGWLACTFSTNGISDPKNQVLSCYEDRAALLETIRTLRTQVDAVIVTPHWGVEYNHTPEAREKKLAREMLDAGALAVFGNHPHVVQPWEKVQTADGREGFVIYSLGNFVSGQVGLAKRSSLILYLGLTKGADGTVTINGARYAPLEMRSSPYTVGYASGESLALTRGSSAKATDSAKTIRSSRTPVARDERALSRHSASTSVASASWTSAGTSDKKRKPVSRSS